MIIRFIVKNLFSFKDYTEFNMLPGRSTRMPHHLYRAAGITLLKMNAMYGANGAGKSNMIRALGLIRNLVKNGDFPVELITETFKFDKKSRDGEIYLGIEFIKDNMPFYYGITLQQGIIIEEELQISGLGKIEDQVLFKRTDVAHQKKLTLEFDKSILQDQEANLFTTLLQNEILERNKPALHFFRHRQNPVFTHYRKAFEWFNQDLIIVSPNSRHGALALFLEQDNHFRSFALDIMKSFRTGIKEIKIETLTLADFFGEDDKERTERFTAELRANPGQHIPYLASYEVIFVLENNRAVAKRLYFLHEEDNGQNRFTPTEESDGTRRLLDYLPALYQSIYMQKVYVIDEIERSIHPLLTKELIHKFSQDLHTKGQLIFTTHESNLLDQDIFRPDEIWFAEKKADGATELYVLSEFKEHHTIDIRKGYLNGRYGAIPFLGNLQDLKWDQYAEAH